MEKKKNFMGLVELRKYDRILVLSGMRPVRRTRIAKNQLFAETHRVFHKACQLADTPPTKRQASKFMKGRGKAFPFRRLAIQDLRETENERS